MRVRAPQIERQLVSVLRAWGMSDPHAETTAQAMVGGGYEVRRTAT